MGQLLDELNDEGKRLSKAIEYYRVVDNEVSVWLQELLDRRKEDYLCLKRSEKTPEGNDQA